VPTTALPTAAPTAAPTFLCSPVLKCSFCSANNQCVAARRVASPVRLSLVVRRCGGCIPGKEALATAAIAQLTSMAHAQAIS
jgi:hypothetical protein